MAVQLRLLMLLVLATSSHGVDINPKGAVLVCLGGVAQFTCSLDEYDKYAHFIINGDDVSKYRTIGVQSSITDVLATLKVPGLQLLNNSNVSCVSLNGSSGPSALIVLGSSVPTIIINCTDDLLSLVTLTHVLGQSYEVAVMVPNRTVLLNTTVQDLQSPISMKGCELCTPCTIAVQAVCNGSAGATTYLNYSVPCTAVTLTESSKTAFLGIQQTSSPLSRTVMKSPWRLIAGTSTAGTAVVALCVGLAILCYCLKGRRKSGYGVSPDTPLHPILPSSPMTSPQQQTSSEGGTAPSECLSTTGPARRLPFTQPVRDEGPTAAAACPSIAGACPPIAWAYSKCFPAQQGLHVLEPKALEAPVDHRKCGDDAIQDQQGERFLSKVQPVSNQTDQTYQPVLVITGQLDRPSPSPSPSTSPSL